MSVNKTTIVKSKLHKDFTIIPNEILKRTDVSLQTKGLFCFIQSLPDNWVLYKNKLWQMTGEGRRKIDTAFSELEEKGYMISVDVIRGGLPQKEYVFYQYPFNEYPNQSNVQNVHSSSTDVQNEQTDVHFAQTDVQNVHLYNTILVNTKLEKEITITETADADLFIFNEKLKAINKSHRDRLMKECNNQLRKSIEKTSNNKFTDDDLLTFNVHLALENKIHEDFNEYCKHFRNYLGKRKMPKK
jgi:hypothetical protein